jgi:Domain of Unknown Function (DUF1080)
MRIATFLLMLSLLAAPAVAQDKTWTPLFDGKGLTGWSETFEDNGSDWSVEGGILEGRGGGGLGNPAVLVTESQHTNYRLMVQFRYLETGAGSIELRRSGEGRITNCYHISTTVPKHQWSQGRSPGNIVKLKNYQYGTAGPPPRRSQSLAAPVGQWHTLEMLVNGNEITTWLNGKPSDHFIDRKGGPASGNIALMVASDSSVQFRTVSILPLPAE